MKGIEIDFMKNWFESFTFEQQVQMSIKHLEHGNVDMLNDQDIILIYTKENL